jgi:CheY-like chemotaxis protein
MNDTLETMSPPEIKSQLVRILHVDDDPDIRLLISASLRQFGYFVATAGSVGEALQLAKELHFNLCILDVRLPDGTGIELCQELRKLQPDAPIIYYSAYADEAEQKTALSVCGDAYLKKPVSAEYLEQTIARLLGRKPRL